jgi:hypothetical protein
VTVMPSRLTVGRVDPSSDYRTMRTGIPGKSPYLQRSAPLWRATGCSRSNEQVNKQDRHSTTDNRKSHENDTAELVNAVNVLPLPVDGLIGWVVAGFARIHIRINARAHNDLLWITRRQRAWTAKRSFEGYGDEAVPPRSSCVPTHT